MPETRNKWLLSSAIGWLALTVILLTLPGSAFPKEDWLSRIWFDKWVHIGLFGILVFLWCGALRDHYPGHKKMFRAFLLTGLAALLFGIAMEFVQKYCIPNRSFDTGDILADGAGSFLGAWYGWRRYIKK